MNKYSSYQQQEGIPDHDCHISPEDGCEYCIHWYTHTERDDECTYCVEEYEGAQWDLAYDRYADDMAQEATL